MKRITATLLAFVLASTAQQAPQTPQTPSDGITTFKSNSQLVVEIVTVNDKSGKPIDGLTAKDFTVTENGTPQTLLSDIVGVAVGRVGVSLTAMATETSDLAQAESHLVPLIARRVEHAEG